MNIDKGLESNALQVLFQNVAMLTVTGNKIPTVSDGYFMRGAEYEERVDNFGQVQITATFTLAYDNDNAEDMRDVETVLDYLCSRGLCTSRPDISKVTPPQVTTKVRTTWEDLPAEGCLP